MKLRRLVKVRNAANIACKPSRVQVLNSVVLSTATVDHGCHSNSLCKRFPTGSAALHPLTSSVGSHIARFQAGQPYKGFGDFEMEQFVLNSAEEGSTSPL